MVVARQNVVEYNYSILFVNLSIMVYDSLIKFFECLLITSLLSTDTLSQLHSAETGTAYLGNFG